MHYYKIATMWSHLLVLKVTGGTFETFCDYRDQKPDISLYDPAIVEDLVDFRFFGY